MLQESTKIYELTHREFALFYVDITTVEFEKGYVLADTDFNPKNDMHTITFVYKSKMKTYYDLFVKWNNEKEERPWKRALTLEEMTNEMKNLLEKRKLHFVNREYYKVYPEYVRAE